MMDNVTDTVCPLQPADTKELCSAATAYTATTMLLLQAVPELLRSHLCLSAS